MKRLIKNNLLLVIPILLLFSCSQNSLKGDFVKNIDELNAAVKEAKPGSEIVLANGIWKDVEIKFYGLGTEKKPITLRAETPGEVFVEGQSYLQMGGEFLVVSGLYFRNGHSPTTGIIRYKIGNDSTAFNSRVTECVIDGFTQPNRWKRDRWIEFYGRNNQLDHSYIAGKSNYGVTLIVHHDGNENINNHHQIVDNYFGPRPRMGGPSAETIRMGDSRTSLSAGRVSVSNNYFDACNGEVEVISDKTGYNSYTNNIFNKCEGSLVLRHANYATVDGNIFIGGDESNFYGGIRVINAGHWITNNYFYKIRGAEFRSGLAIMNGIPRSPINRYQQVSDAVIAYNTWVDCKSPWQIGVGQNLASADVLPKSEIRSAAPIRTIIANNLVYNTEEDKVPVVNYDDMEGILFKNNTLDNGGIQYDTYKVFKNEKLKMKQVNDWLFVPENSQNQGMDSVYVGFDFDKIDHDLFGDTRAKNNRIGAINELATAEEFVIDKKKYGPKWFSPEKEVRTPQIILASSDLAGSIKKAQSGDIIELSEETYTIATSLKIDKEITLRSKGTAKVTLVFQGNSDSPAFEMNPKGILRLENLKVKGNKSQMAFGTLEENMFSAYNLFIDNCLIEDFNQVLKATKGSFADSISVSNSTIQNCENGFTLAAEQKGNYNAEMVTFENCKFINVGRDLINFYRGGYDESTIGGYLRVLDSSFERCGSKEKSGQLLKTRGIINVDISRNTFRNNPVKLIALLWGEKNNHNSENVVTNSGIIKVEQQLKLDLLY